MIPLRYTAVDWIYAPSIMRGPAPEPFVFFGEPPASGGSGQGVGAARLPGPAEEMLRPPPPPQQIDPRTGQPISGPYDLRHVTLPPPFSRR